MTALLLTLGVFGVWWVIGLGLLAAIRADTASLRIALTAPALGSCVTLVPLFLFSLAEVPMDQCATPVVIVLFVAALIVLGLRRPPVAPRVIVILVICVGGLLIAASPMLKFGFNWIANANDDMANYSLSALDLVHHGLLSHFDLNGLAHNRDYSTIMGTLHRAGARPGGDITLAALASVTGKLPYQTFMPLIFASALTGACAAGALALQAARRWWAAALAATLLLVSPLATFGALQQLLPQVWGLALACALVAYVMRKELHQGRRLVANELIPIGLLATSIVIVYVELATTLVLAYGLYLVVLAVRRELSIVALLRLWIPVIVIAVVVINIYLPREVNYVAEQASFGVAAARNELPTFGYTLIPLALPGIIGIATMPASLLNVFPTDLSIILGAVVLGAVLVGAIISLRRGMAAAVVLVAYALLALLLAINASDFGLYKLFMYLQPFLAAAVAVWVSSITSRRVLSIAGVLLVALVVVQLAPTRRYVNDSTNPIDLANASAPQLLPAFRRDLAASPAPVVSVTENPTLAKLEAIVAGERPLIYVGAPVFGILAGTNKANALGHETEEQAVTATLEWRKHNFQLWTGGGKTDSFGEDPSAAPLLQSGHCQLVIPSGSELPFNRWQSPEGTLGLVDKPCGAVHAMLAFTQSALGAEYYTRLPFKEKTLYQLEAVPLSPKQTMAGIGRYLLFHVLGARKGERLELNLTTSYVSNTVLPPAVAVGNQRYSFPMLGEGSARVFSPPLKMQEIDGQQYVLLDLGRNGALYSHERSGLEALWGSNVVLDPRYLTGYLRDLSLVGPAEYAQIHAPTMLRGFPSCLANRDLQYSGIFEDGWVGRESYVVLAGGDAAELNVQAEVPAGYGGRITIYVAGHPIYSRPDTPGALNLRLPVPASRYNRRIELRFSSSMKLPPPDNRPVSARLLAIGLSS